MLPLTAIKGQLMVGKYQVALTFVRDDGQESGSDRPELINLSDEGGIDISLPGTTDSTVKYINIYISHADGETLYLAHTVDIGTASLQYQHTAEELVYPLKTKLLLPPPPGHFVEYFNGRIYIADKNILWYSEPYSYELCRYETNFMPFESNITLLGAVDDGIFLATQEETMFMAGDGPPFKRSFKAEYGAIPGTMAKCNASYFGKGKAEGDAVFWESTRGKCVGLKEGGFKNLTEGNYLYAPGKRGAGIIKQTSGMNQYLSILQDASGETAYNVYS
jgi:hypothetical protein